MLLSFRFFSLSLSITFRINLKVLLIIINRIVDIPNIYKNLDSDLNMKSTSLYNHSLV